MPVRGATLLVRTTPLAARGAKLELVRSHDKGGTVYSVGLTPDGRTAFIGGDMSNRGVEVWDTTTGNVLRRVKMPGVFVAVSPDGHHGACAPFIGGNVEYIDLDDGAMVGQFKHGSTVMCLDFSGDGSRLVTSGADRAVCAFDVASGEQLTRIEFPDHLKRAAFSPDGKLIAVTCANRKLYLCNADTGQKVRDMSHPACPWGVAFSPDGGQVITGTGGVLVGKTSDLMVQPEDDNTLRIWDVATGKLLGELKGHTHTISSIAYSPDGRRVASASLDRSLRLWDVETRRELARVDGQGWCNEAVFSFDGTLVLVGGGAEKTSNSAAGTSIPRNACGCFASSRRRAKRSSVIPTFVPRLMAGSHGHHQVQPVAIAGFGRFSASANVGREVDAANQHRFAGR